MSYNNIVKKYESELMEVPKKKIVRYYYSNGTCVFSEEVTSTFQTYNHSYCHTVKQDVVVNQGEIDAAIAHNIKLKVKIKNDWFVELRNEYPEFSDDVFKILYDEVTGRYDYHNEIAEELACFAEFYDRILTQEIKEGKIAVLKR